VGDVLLQSEKILGVLAPVITPFREDLSPDADKFLAHCRWLLANGCAGLAVFGTNSEANSLSVGEKAALLDMLVGSGVPAAQLMPGTGHCALTDTVSLTRKAVELGCGGVLVLPPFYYQDVSEEGVFRSFSELIERVGDTRLRVYLYHIPALSRVAIKPALIERLLRRYPGTVVGMKDSSGDWAHTQTMLTAFAHAEFDIFVGSESFLLKNLRQGGKGCITATGNVNPGPISELYRRWTTEEAEGLQASIDVVRCIVQRHPMISALKAILAAYSGEAGWRRVRPPLIEMDLSEVSAMLADLRRCGFVMPGLRGSLD
jgi:4-hydroxy-tetrahydrodipicolinate synthase